VELSQKGQKDSHQRRKKGAYRRETAIEDTYGGLQVASLDASGFFRLAQTQGRWFLVTPEGHPFYIIALNGVTPWYGPYKKNSFNSKYRKDFTLWANVAVDRANWLGFNTLAYKTAENLLREMKKGLVWKMPFTVLIPFTENNAASRTEFPDIFSQGFTVFADSVAKRYCGTLKNEPYLVGYFLGNELDFDLHKGGEIHWRSRWVKTLLKQNPGSPARKQFAALVKNTFGSVVKLNEAFEGSKHQFSSFDEIGFEQVWPAFKKNVPQAVQMIEDFNALIAQRFYKVTTEAIRKHDTNHLILGSRFGSDAEMKVLIATNDYTDVVSINKYPQGGKFPSETFEKMYSNTNKPLFHTEFSYLLEGKNDVYPSAPDQETRGRFYTMQVSKVVEQDKIIGFGWHEMIDPNDETNFGFLNTHDEFYFDMIKYVMEANRSVKKRFAEIIKASMVKGR